MRDICVYCGSSPGRREEYVEAARAFAGELVARDLGLVYGGASVGVMGAVADAVLAQGGRVTGVIPQALQDKEIAHPALTDLHITGSMHERKTKMAELSDGFVAMPGGVGTLEELFEIWTWGQLGWHGKPCAVLNVAGYYDGLIRFLDHAADEQFLRPWHRDMLLVEEQPARLLERMADYQKPQAKTWVKKGEL
ncbi:LOG family protein [Alloalcanivorax mobilis]|uniref:LOG family protein n=1 Tax=Alloalcanivorax mobilis TaxID=2019569 RepID=UPI000B5B37CA|nr:TIGR00730 family Rossman fold protein [Alloalcanivorax mobilis]ASK33061.1 Rossman fold protein, TIGR00730 family [Alcanivorax sp. N3-2A]ASK36879.1 Rossman fold protein, TIGR00730 family [Alcanivorax sp. N3-2A]|tara:strand:- start:14772 stop:15353 length:582 start_codon:yes stop_codon:yes gene_type:complete